MIIHSPIISGSMTFADGASVTYPEGGVYSGSFSGSFQGEGSNLTFGGTGIVSSSAQIDNLFNLDGVFSSSQQVEFNDINNNPLSQSASSVTLSKSMVPSATNIDLGTAENPFRDVYISSASLYINGTQVISTNGTDLTIQTDAGESFKVLETGNDTITLETANGDITLTSSGNGNIELDAPVQIAAHNKILSSDGNSIQFGNGLGVTGSIAVTGTVDGVDVSGFKNTFNSYTSSNDTTNTNQDSRLSNIEAATSSYQSTLSITDTTNVDLILSSNTLSANLKGGVISGSAQLLNVATDFGSGRVSGEDFGDVAGTTTFTGSFVGDGTSLEGVTSYTDSDNTDHLNSLGVISGSAQITDVLSSLNTYTGSTVQPHIDSTSNPHSVTKSHVGLGNVENTALSTWGGSSNITTLGTVTTGDVQTILPSGTISGSEQIEDVVGGMVTGNTETGISVAYQDGDGTLDFAVQYGSSANTAVQGNTSLSFQGTSNEISIDGGSSITLGSGGTVTIGLADTIAGSRTFSNNVTITGNLTVNGTTTTVNSNTVNIGDNVLVLNSDETGTPSQNGGLEIERGSSTNSALLWDESNDYWVAGLAGSEVQIALVNGTYSGLRAQSTTADDVGLGNVTNESKSTMFSSPTFTGTVSGVTKSHVGLANVENTALSTYTGQGGALDNQYITNGAGYITSFTNTNQLTTFVVEDGDGTEVTISQGKEWKFVEGTGIDINWTDTSNGTDGDPYDLTITNTAPMTGDEFDNDGTYASLRAQGTTKGDVGLGNVENTALSTYTGDGGALDNQYIANGANYISSFDITTQTDSKYLRSNATDTASGVITFSNTTASTTTTTGAVKVTGGVGIGGALNVGGDVVAYASSDERLKDNIELISNPIEKVQSLKGVTWNWNENADELQQSLPNVGVIAQDVEKVLPQLVTDRDNGFKGVDYAKLTGLLIEAIKEQQKQIDELKSKIQ